MMMQTRPKGLKGDEFVIHENGISYVVSPDNTKDRSRPVRITRDGELQPLDQKEVDRIAAVTTRPPLQRVMAAFGGGPK